MNDSIVALEALMVALPRLGMPALIITQLVVETPVLLLRSWAMGVFGLRLLGGLAAPAILTLVRQRQHPPGPRNLETAHGL